MWNGFAFLGLAGAIIGCTSPDPINQREEPFTDGGIDANRSQPDSGRGGSTMDGTANGDAPRPDGAAEACVNWDAGGFLSDDVFSYVDGALSHYLGDDIGDGACDCTAEHPCPMRCGGAYPQNGDGDWDFYYPERAAPVCLGAISRNEPCPTGTFSDRCGAVRIDGYREFQQKSVDVELWFDPITFEQRGWELYFSGLSESSQPYRVRYCGGVVPEPQCTNRPRDSVSCWGDPNAETCECPSWPRCEE